MFSGQNPPACSVLRMKNTVWTQCWVGDGAKGTVQWLIRGAREPTLTTALLPYLPSFPAHHHALPSLLPVFFTLAYHYILLPFHITTLHPIYYTSISPPPTCNIFLSRTSSNQWRLLSTALYSRSCISTIDFLQFICPVHYTKRCMVYLQGVPFIHGEAFSWQGA